MIRRASPWNFVWVAVCLASLGGACSLSLSGEEDDDLADDGAPKNDDDEEDGDGDGEGLPVKNGAWTYTEVDGAVCGDGSPVGVATNRGSSSRLVIYLEGGGACWSALTCDNGAAVFVSSGLPSGQIDQILSLGPGIFDRTAAANVFADDSFAYVPYCTGDIHSGRREETPWGVSHVGGNNVTAMLPRILATFPDIDEVVLTGTSAGGYGASYNAARLRALLPAATTLSVLIDSAAALPTFPGAEGVARAQLDAWQPELCDDCDTLSSQFDELLATLPDVRFGLIQSNADQTLRSFFAPSFQPLSASTWDAALDDWVQARADVENLRVFITSGSKHVYLYDRDLAATVVDGVALSDFMAGVVGDGAFVSALSP
jgi:hypothetical protein